MKTFTITLPDDSAALVERWLAAQTWDNVDDLMTYAVEMVRQDIARDAYVDHDWLKEQIRQARESSARGDVA
ncbi:MAG: hypothetical protein ACRC7O_06975, partial [Fimbriiglobus sp.]